MATIDRTIPSYQDGYEITYQGSDDLYHCLRLGTELSKKNGKPATFKSLKLAKTFMDEQGVQAALPEPKKTGADYAREGQVIRTEWAEKERKICPECGVSFAYYGDTCQSCYEKSEAAQGSEAWQMLVEADASWNNRFQHPLPEPVITPAKERVTFVVGQYRQGDEITDDRGNVYTAVKDSYYVSERESADMENGWDATVDVGWHTPAILIRRA